MNKLVLPKNAHKGLKIFCKKCNKDNSKCRHYDSQVYRVRIHIPGTKNSVKTKKLDTTDYNEAIIESIKFEKELNATAFTTISNVAVQDTADENSDNNDYSLADAVIKYKQYLNGESCYSHLKKDISDDYRKELLRYCRYFSKNVHKTKDITKLRVKDVNRDHVSKFYIWAEKEFKEKTLKKCMSSLKGFFAFLIDIEEIDIRNPFRTYVIKEAVGSAIETITKEEFQAVLEAVDTADPILQLGGKGEKKNMYRSYLKQAYKLFLLTGCRREELVDLKWNNIHSFDESVKFLYINNIKVQRIKNRKNVLRPIPITSQLMDLLVEMGYNEKYMTVDYADDFILCPKRKMELQAFMDFLSKSFTHYWKSTGIKKDYSLKNLRKTYFTWVNRVMGDDTKIVSSHSTNDVLKRFYLDPKLSSVIAKGAAEIKIFD